MNLDGSDLREMLGDSMARYASERYGFDARREFLNRSSGVSEEAWRDAAEQGWLAFRLPPDHGGAGAGCRTAGTIMRLVGRHLLLEPWLQSACLAAACMRVQENGFQPSDLVALADGSMVLAVAWRPGEADGIRVDGGRLVGNCRGLLHGEIAHQVIVPVFAEDGAMSLWRVELAAADVSRRVHRLIDGRRVADIHFGGAVASPVCEGKAAADLLARLQDEASALLCAESVGVMSRMFELTLEYVKLRKQFGRPIGSNQAVQHRLVEMRLLVEEAEAMTAAALEALDQQPADSVAVPGAAAVIFDALQWVGDQAIQMHGGIGITEEAEISHYYRRASVIRGLLGPREPHMQKFISAFGGRHAG